jgi:hypothetical protein
MMTSREIVHQAIDELSEAEAGIVLETFTDRRKHEAPGVALRQAFVEAYRIRDLEEGLRMEKHPGIVFSNGTGGRSATLSDGPAVWEIVETLKGTELTDQQAIAAITTTAEWGALPHAQLQTAVRYYADFHEEVDEKIALNSQKPKPQRGSPPGEDRE